jgi:hypothetical protein
MAHLAGLVRCDLAIVLLGLPPLEGHMTSVLRSIIGFLVVVSVLSIIAAQDMAGARPQEDRRAATQRLTGSWDTEVLQDGFPPTRRLFTFTSDGAAVGTAVLQATPVGVQLFGAPHGAWIRTGDRQFIASFIALRQAINGDSAGSFKLRVSLTLNESGTEWDGEFFIEFFLPDGTPIFTGHGTVHGTRIMAE